MATEKQKKALEKLARNAEELGLYEDAPAAPAPEFTVPQGDIIGITIQFADGHKEKAADVIEELLRYRAAEPAPAIPPCDPADAECPRCNRPNGPKLGPCKLDPAPAPAVELPPLPPTNVFRNGGIYGDDVFAYDAAAMQAYARAAVEQLVRENALLRHRLPNQMQECVIRFRECEKGHGWLTALNWVQHECQVCRAERAEKARDITYDEFRKQADEIGVLLDRAERAERERDDALALLLDFQKRDWHRGMLMLDAEDRARIDAVLKK